MQNSDMLSGYTTWKDIIGKTALETIGKTTLKTGSKRNESGIVKSIRNEKRTAKKMFETECCTTKKPILKAVYIQKQAELRKQIEYEQEEIIRGKFSTMAEEGNTGFWKEIKRKKRDNFAEWISLKDDDGNRILDSEIQKEKTAKYYENLYSFDPNLDGHPPHPPLAAIGRKKILNIATMLVGFSNLISTPPCMFEKILLGKF